MGCLKRTVTGAVLYVCLMVCPLMAQESSESVVLSVLPFRSMGDSASLNLGESFSETITTKLVGLRGLKVYERAQFDKVRAELNFQRDSDLVDRSGVVQMGAIITMDYLVLGSVTLAGDRFSSLIRLVRVKDGADILSRQYEGTWPGQIFDMQDAMTLELVQSLNLKLSDLEKKRISRKPTKSVDSWSLYNKSLGKVPSAERIVLLKKALDADPEFTQAAHLLADTYTEQQDAASALAVYAGILQRDPENFRALYNSALLHFDKGEIVPARTFMETCCSLNDADPDIYYHLGLFAEYNPQGERLGSGSDMNGAISRYDRCLQLDPLHRQSLVALGMLKLVLAQVTMEPERQLALLREAVDCHSRYLKISPDALDVSEIQSTVQQATDLVAQLEIYLSKKE